MVYNYIWMYFLAVDRNGIEKNLVNNVYEKRELMVYFRSKIA